MSQETTVDFGFNLDPPVGQPVREGAEVVDMGKPASGDRVVSRHGSHVRSLHMPSASGAVSQSPSLFLRYDFHGRLVERIDARSVVVRYEHDDLGRLASLEIGHYDGETFVHGYPDSMLLSETMAPSDRITYIEYEYAADMNSVEAWAWSGHPSASGLLVASNKFEFDGRGQLTHDWQAFGEEIGEDSAHTLYTWSVAHCDDGESSLPVLGHKRLAEMGYPVAPWMDIDERRVLTFEYGTSGLSDDTYDRITTITSIVQEEEDEVARFAWVGDRRRAWMTLGTSHILQDFGLATDVQQDPIGLTGLDQFGRIVDLHYRHGPQSSPGSTLTRIEYTYDLLGNRLTATRTPRPAGLDPATWQEQNNNYDAFNRLREWQATNFNSSSVGSVLRQDVWTLDLLGNWDLRHTRFDSGPEVLVEHLTDGRNRINAIEMTIGTNPAPTHDETVLLYDDAGNLIFDGGHFYQYDAWNRLVQVNQAELIEEEIVGGPLVKHYTYDAAGRLARTLSPYPEPGEDTPLRSERFFYDGIRRIVEVVIDPVESLMSAQSDPELSALAAQTVGASLLLLDGQSAPAVFEAAQLDDEDPQQPPLPSSRIDREYVWGPGDAGGRGVDELLAQFDPWGELMPVLQDAGGDCIALCDLRGSGETARIVAQWTYDPYGQVISHEHVVALHPHLRAGHKGLFVDRLDAGVADQYGEDLPRLVEGADLLVYNRNRTYKPDLGRFMQMDPNASGLVLIASAAYAGEELNPRTSAFDLETSHADGSNLYNYLMSNTHRNSDPLGLFIGDMVRGALMEMVTQYSAHQDWDVGWASDWTAQDDWHSRLDNRWIELAWFRGAIQAVANDGIQLDPFGDLVFARFRSRTLGLGTRLVRTPWGRGTFSEIVRHKQYQATVFNNPFGGRKLVRFEGDAIKTTATVTPSNSKKEIRDANRQKGFKKTPRGWVWHHHWQSGKMQLVPKKLHKKVGHIGRRQGWPPERFGGVN